MGLHAHGQRAIFELAMLLSERQSGERARCSTPIARRKEKMAEKQVFVGVLPQVMVIEPEDQVCWLSDAGSLRIEFDPNRCPFSSNVFQAPAGMRLLSGTPRPGTKPASYRYRLWLNDQLVGSGEVILREK